MKDTLCSLQVWSSQQLQSPPPMAKETSKMLLMGRKDTLAMKCGLIRQDLDRFWGHVTSAENCISDMEDTAAITTQYFTELQRTTDKILMAQSEDAENRLRCNNKRVVGLPDGVEGLDPTSFAESRLCIHSRAWP